MRARVIGGLLLLAAGGALPYLALQKAGAPWEFRERAAVVTEAVGSVEVRSPSGEVRPDLARGDAVLPLEEIRVGALSRLGVITRERALVALSDTTRASFDEEVLRVERGWLTATVGAKPLKLRVPVLEADLELTEGEYVLAFDGIDRLELRVLKGSARASVEGGPWAPGNPGNLLRVGRGEKPVWGAPDGPLKCTATCRRLGGRAAVEGSARAGVQVFVNGRPTFADKEGQFNQSLPLSKSETHAVVFGRDASGNVCRVSASCGS